MPKNARSEKFYEREIIQFFSKEGWWVRKLHGDRFQRGLPDLLLCSPEGNLKLVELKVVKESGSYSSIDLFSLLKGPQTGNILLLAKRKAPIFIIGCCNKGYFLGKFPLYSVCYPETLEQIAKELRSL